MRGAAQSGRVVPGQGSIVKGKYKGLEGMMNAKLISAAAVCVLVMGLTAVTGPVGVSRAAEGKSEIPNPEIPRMSAHEARKLFNDGKLILVNAQEPKGQAKSMLLGAIGAPDGLINGSELRIPENLIVAFYCM